MGDVGAFAALIANVLGDVLSYLRYDLGDIPYTSVRARERCF